LRGIFRFLSWLFKCSSQRVPTHPTLWWFRAVQVLCFTIRAGTTAMLAHCIFDYSFIHGYKCDYKCYYKILCLPILNNMVYIVTVYNGFTNIYIYIYPPLVQVYLSFPW
jgi:hypothetical protein